MIYSINGQVKSKEKNSVILQTGQICWQIFVSNVLFEQTKIGQQITLYTYLRSREDTIELYGLSTAEELQFFRQLVNISGIGPKTAIDVFSIANLSEIKTAIDQGNINLLTRVSGIGKKTAGRIILELKNKIVQPEVVSDSDQEVIDALVHLGCRNREARQLVQQLPSNLENTTEKLKVALKTLKQIPSKH